MDFIKEIRLVWTMKLCLSQINLCRRLRMNNNDNNNNNMNVCVSEYIFINRYITRAYVHINNEHNAVEGVQKENKRAKGVLNL